jgi:DNA repair exonuclease SbcCD nuclease subunit
MVMALFVLSAGMASADNKWKGDFFFIQLADPQLGMWDSNKTMTKEIETFTKAIKHINRLKPAFVVISGDMLNVAHDPRQTREFWRMAHEINADIPIYLVPGNHDVTGAPSPEDIKSYQKLFGKDRYAFSYNGCEFVVLNSSLLYDPSRAPKFEKEQWEWFQQQLADSREKSPAHLFVLTHCPWFLASPEEEKQYFNVPPETRKKYLAVMRLNGVDVAVAGHYHMNKIAKDGPMQMITTSAIGMPLGKDPSGFRVFRVYQDRVEHEYYGLDQVPDQVKMH